MLFTKLALGVDWSGEGLKLAAAARRFRQLAILDSLAVPEPGAKDGKSKVEEFLKRNHLAEARVVVCLPRETFIVRFLDLPSEAEPQLAKVISYQVDSLHPFQDTIVRWDAAVVGRNAQAKQIRVMVAIAEVAALDRYRQALAELGLRPDSLTLAAAPLAGLLGASLPEAALVALGRGSRVELLGFRQGSLVAARELESVGPSPAQQFEREWHALRALIPAEATSPISVFQCGTIPGAWSDVCRESRRLPALKQRLAAPPRFDLEAMLPALAAACTGLERRPALSLNLLPLEARLLPSRWGRAPLYALSGSAALMGLVVLAHGLLEPALYGSAVSRRIQQLRPQAEAVERQDEQMARLSGRAALLAGLRTQTWQKLLVLRELTNLLPDGTWVQSLDVGPGTAEFSGLSTRAADLIQPLENSPYFSQVEFASPITRGGDNKDVFRIRMRLGKQATGGRESGAGNRE